MKAPAVVASGPLFTIPGPYIIAREAKYPLETEKTDMNKIGQTSLSNQTGSVRSSGLQLHNRNKGTNINRHMLRITSHLWLRVGSEPATIRPVKSPQLKRRKQVMGVKKVVVRGLLACTLTMEDVMTGKMEMVTTKVSHTEKSIHRIFLMIVQFETSGARNEWESSSVTRSR